MRDIYENMTKEQLVRTYLDIVKHLKSCKALIDAYAGQKVNSDHPMCKVTLYTELLMIERLNLRHLLINKYGIFIM